MQADKLYALSLTMVSWPSQADSFFVQKAHKLPDGCGAGIMNASIRLCGDPKNALYFQKDGTMNMAEESGALGQQENNTRAGECDKRENTGEDLFYSESNLEHLRRTVAALNAGEGREHELMETETEG